MPISENKGILKVKNLPPPPKKRKGLFANVETEKFKESVNFPLFLIIQLLLMRKMFFCLLTIISTQFLLAQKTYIWCGVLIDGISSEPKKNMTIVVEKNKIVAVENGFTKAGAVGVDVDSLTDSKVFG